MSEPVSREGTMSEHRGSEERKILVAKELRRLNAIFIKYKFPDELRKNTIRELQKAAIELEQIRDEIINHPLVKEHYNFITSEYKADILVT